MDMLNMFKNALVGCAALLAVGAVPLTAIAGDERSMRYNEAQSQARFNLIKAVQQALTDAGYDAGTADGLEGSRTTDAIIAYQRDKSLIVDGTIGAQTLRSLGLTD